MHIKILVDYGNYDVNLLLDLISALFNQISPVEMKNMTFMGKHNQEGTVKTDKTIKVQYNLGLIGIFLETNF